MLADLGYKVELVHVDTETNSDVARARPKAINEGRAPSSARSDPARRWRSRRSANSARCRWSSMSPPRPTSRSRVTSISSATSRRAGAGDERPQKLINEVAKAANVEFKTAAFLHANDTFGTGQRQAMDAIFPKLNMPFQLVESIAYDPKAQDLSVEVTKLRSINPDLLIIVTRAGDAIKLTRDMVRQKFEPKAIMSPGSPGLYDQEFFDAVGPYADYFIYNLPWAIRSRR